MDHADAVRWMNDRNAEQPEYLQAMAVPVTGDIRVTHEVKHAINGPSPDTFTTGGGTLPKTGNPGDTYQTSSCNIQQKTTETDVYVWSPNAGGPGQGGWVLIKRTVIYDANMTVCPGL